MFEMKYDKDGLPIKNPQIEAENTQESSTASEPIKEVQQSSEENLQQETQVSPQESSEEKKSKIDSDYEENLIRLRQKTKRLERERDEAIRLAQEMNQTRQQNTQTKPGLDPDELVSGKHINEHEQKIKELEQKQREYEQRVQNLVLEAQLRNDFPDIDKVITQENIELLKDTDPDIAEAIANMPDPYKKAAIAYKTIKKAGIMKDSHQIEKAIAQRNINKPKPVNTISAQQGETPLSRVNAFAQGELTDELKKELYKEMLEAKKNY